MKTDLIDIKGDTFNLNENIRYVFFQNYRRLKIFDIHIIMKSFRHFIIPDKYINRKFKNFYKFRMIKFKPNGLSNLMNEVLHKASKLNNTKHILLPEEYVNDENNIECIFSYSVVFAYNIYVGGFYFYSLKHPNLNVYVPMNQYRTYYYSHGSFNICSILSGGYDFTLPTSMDIEKIKMSLIRYGKPICIRNFNYFLEKYNKMIFLNETRLIKPITKNNDGNYFKS